MKLYTYFRSSASYRVRIALAYKGLAHDAAYVSLPKNEHQADAFRAVNAQALVPALEDGGRVLIQSLAIMEYLDETHPEPPLLPKGALDRAYVRAVAQIIACEMHPLNNLRTLRVRQAQLQARRRGREHLVPPLDRRRVRDARGLSRPRRPRRALTATATW